MMFTQLPHFRYREGDWVKESGIPEHHLRIIYAFFDDGGDGIVDDDEHDTNPESAGYSEGTRTKEVTVAEPEVWQLFRSMSA